MRNVWHINLCVHLVMMQGLAIELIQDWSGLQSYQEAGSSWRGIIGPLWDGWASVVENENSLYSL